MSTVGRDEAVIRDYIRKQEEEDKRLDQLNQIATVRWLNPAGPR